MEKEEVQDAVKASMLHSYLWNAERTAGADTSGVKLIPYLDP